MTTALDLLEALAGPAALAAPGAPIAGNAAFRALDPAPDLSAGAPEGWTATPVAGGAVLWRVHVARAEEARVSARERLLATLSHEIRTPLNGVLGMAGLLAGTRLDGAQRAYLKTLTDSGEHLLGLVNDILDFAKLDAGKLEFERAPVRVDDVLRSVAELLSPRATAKGVEIAWAAAAGLPVVLADEGRLRQILFNLAGNAVKFTETGGVLLTAEAVPAGSDAVRLRLVVRDTGPGVPPEAQARIFDEFAHASAEDGVRHGGAGLGLAIVRRLATALGGEIRVDSAIGEGAVFTFETLTPIAEARTLQGRPLAGRTLAVVSPNPVLREAAARQIATAGGAVLLCASQVEARAAPPETVVLVDHAAREAGRPATRVRGRSCLILLTPDERGRADRYLNAGFAGWLMKPLRPESLVDRVLALDGVASEALAHDDERAAAPAAAGLRVLLVEDNPVNAVLATALLKREGCAVDKAADGEEALEALARSAYDLVLLDMRMPGLDGPETARRYRAAGGATPIVALTANAFEEDRRACLEAGMDDFLTKPLDAAALRATVARWTPRAAQVRLAG